MSEISTEKIRDWSERARTMFGLIVGEPTMTEKRAAWLLAVHATEIAEQRDQARAERDQFYMALSDLRSAVNQASQLVHEQTRMIAEFNGAIEPRESEGGAA